MNTETVVLLCSLALTALLSLGVVFYLGPPMRGVMRDLCGTEERARYWVAFANVMHLLLPVTAVLALREPPRAGVSLQPATAPRPRTPGQR